jgi:hypothetical protein
MMVARCYRKKQNVIRKGVKRMKIMNEFSSLKRKIENLVKKKN